MGLIKFRFNSDSIQIQFTLEVPTPILRGNDFTNLMYSDIFKRRQALATTYNISFCKVREDLNYRWQYELMRELCAAGTLCRL
ncbi:hypothetical protein VN97_g5351 [Penicillium thymicola]|uniref:Uncharacterized protein n=1 Tax=Penicillium thymicola TaxID=293382 RepID=A0AAI9X921_PENTH|nr:hypothetical protein VN97_g5351 [Penicillium thymicola]